MEYFIFGLLFSIGWTIGRNVILELISMLCKYTLPKCRNKKIIIVHSGSKHVKMLQIEQQKLKLKVLNKIEPTKALSFVYAKTTYPFMERSDIMKTFLGITTGLLSGFLIGVVFSIKASAPANAEIPTEAEPEEPVKTTPKKSTKKTSTTKNKES